MANLNWKYGALYQTFLSLFILISLSLVAKNADAECCEGCYGHCADGYECQKSDWYCGNGPCNVFGCNCDGGCRKCNSPKSCCIDNCKSVYSQTYNGCAAGCWDAVPACLNHCGVIASEEQDKCKRKCGNLSSSTNQTGNAVASGVASLSIALNRFAVADVNDDGTITLDEFQSIPCDRSQPDVHERFEAMDKDKSGKLTFDEIDSNAFQSLVKNDLSLPETLTVLNNANDARKDHSRIDSEYVKLLLKKAEKGPSSTAK